MRILYLGEASPESYIADTLRGCGKFDRVDHLTKPTLAFGHVSMSPCPDVIILKCDWEQNELDWVKRYSPEIPKIFVVCDMCTAKIAEYAKHGNVYYVDAAIRSFHDLELTGLITMIENEVDKHQ